MNNVKWDDKYELIASLRSEIAFLRADLAKNAPDTGKGILGPINGYKLERRLFLTMNINQQLLKSCKAMLKIIKDKKCADYWDKPHLIGAEEVIKMAEKQAKVSIYKDF